jgi:hypothetical protein
MVKVAILPKGIHMFKAIPIGIPMTFTTEIKKSILRFIWTPKAILSESAALFKSQYPTSNRAITIKTTWCRHNYRQED